MPQLPTVPFDPLAKGPLSGFGGLPDDQMPPVSYGTMAREPLPHVDSRVEEITTVPPLWPSLGSQDDAYYVTVSDGVVCEHVTDSGLGASAIELHKCPSRLDGANLREFPIEVGEAIFIRVVDDGTGHIGIPEDSDFDEAVDLVVMPKDQKSLNLIQTIQDGIYYYKLAELEATGDNVKLVPFLAGSNIHHVSGLTADSMLVGCDGDPLADPPVEPTMIQRHSFLRGVLVKLDETLSNRPLATTNSVKAVARCCEPT